jgi:hypothetical protein
MTLFDKHLHWLIELCRTNQAWKEYAWWKAGVLEQDYPGMRDALTKEMKRDQVQIKKG